MARDDRGISDAFFTVMSIGIVVLAGLLISSTVLTFAGSQGKAAASQLEGLQEQGMESGVSAFYYTINPAAPDLSSADPNRIPPVSYITMRTAQAISVGTYSLPEASPVTDGMVIWTGYVLIPAEGEYTFTLDCAGGSWLWIDGQLTVDNHGNHPGSPVSSAPLHLTAGQHRVKARYFYTGEAFCQLSCNCGGNTIELRYCH